MDNIPVVNEVAATTVDQNLNETNTNGVPGSLPGETRAETAARLYKVTVDGQEMEVDENELRRGYAHNKAAAKRMEEAANQRKEAEHVLQLFKSNPREAMKALGLDAKQFAEQVINHELQESILTPEQKELRHYREQVAAYEKQQAELKAQQEQESMQQQLTQQAELIQNQIITALDTSGLPKNERTVSKIIYYMQSYLKSGFDVTPNDVIDQVKADYQNDIKHLMAGLTEEQIEQYLGNDLVSKVAKSTIKKQQSFTTKVPKAVNQNVGKPVEPKKIKSPRDFFGN